jgi:hypothetical protein
VIANEDEFCHGAVRMSVTMLTVVLGLASRFYGAGNAGPDSLHQQVPSGIAHMGKALDAQHGFLRSDHGERLVQGGRGLGGLAAQDKREPARIFGVHMLMRQQAMLMRTKPRMRVPIAVRLPSRGGRHARARPLRAKLVEV